MTWLIRIAGVVIAAVAMSAAGGAERQYSVDHGAVVLEFQRAADTYVFRHRQSDRRGDVPNAVEGALFTPLASAVFRTRIAAALSKGSCEVTIPAASFTVPQVNSRIDGTEPAPPCIVAALPRLPEELEYRLAGVALVLADTHLHTVVDVLHAAFQPRD